MTAPTATTTRLLQLLSLLQSRRDWPGAVLAERLQISHRTVRRDVDRLREMGYSIHATMGPDGGYRLEAGTDLPPMLFDDEQAVALAIALQSAMTIGAGIEESALRALSTVRQVMPSRLRHMVDALQLTALTDHSGGTARGTASAPVLMEISTAIRDRLVLRFDYTSVSDDGDAAGFPKAARRVEPHHAVVAGGRWYLVAWDLDRDDWRLFRIDRLSPRTPTGPRFEPREIPGGDVRQFISSRFRGSTARDEWPCTGTVVLDLPAGAVRPFASQGIVEQLGDDQCRVTLSSWSWGSLAATFARFEAAMREVEPPALVDAFAVLADRFAAVAMHRRVTGGEHPVRNQEAATRARD